MAMMDKDYNREMDRFLDSDIAQPEGAPDTTQIEGARNATHLGGTCCQTAREGR